MEAVRNAGAMMFVDVDGSSRGDETCRYRRATCDGTGSRDAAAACRLSTTHLGISNAAAGVKRRGVVEYPMAVVSRDGWLAGMNECKKKGDGQARRS